MKQLDPEMTDLQRTGCICNHLTSFASWHVPVNPLPKLEWIKFKEGYILTVVSIVLLAVLAIGLVVMRKADLIDREALQHALIVRFQNQLHLILTFV